VLANLKSGPQKKETSIKKGPYVLTIMGKSSGIGGNGREDRKGHNASVGKKRNEIFAE